MALRNFATTLIETVSFLNKDPVIHLTNACVPISLLRVREKTEKLLEMVNTQSHIPKIP